MQVKTGSYNYPHWDNFIKIYQWKVKFISKKLGNAGLNFLCAMLMVYLHYYSVFNYMITRCFHPQRLSGRFKLRIFRIQLLIFIHWLKKQLALEGIAGEGAGCEL